MDEYYEVENIKKEEIEQLIDGGTSGLIEIENKINKAKDSANEALTKAREVKDLKTNLLLNAKSINYLKDTCSCLADALADSVDCQRRMQEYQKNLANFTKKLFMLSVSSVAAGDLAISKLKEIVINTKNSKVGEETKKQIDLIIKQIKDQQSIIGKIDELKCKINQQQKNINELMIKIDGLEISKEGLATADASITLNKVLKESLKRVGDMCYENNEIIRQHMSNMNASILNETTTVTNFLLEKHYEELSLLSEKAKILGELINSSFNQLWCFCKVIKDEIDTIRISIQDFNESFNEQGEQFISCLDELKSIENKNTKTFRTFKITSFILFGLIICFLLALLFLFIFK